MNRMNKKLKTDAAKQLKLINDKIDVLTEKMINENARNMKQLLELAVCLKNLEYGKEALEYNTTLLK